MPAIAPSSIAVACQGIRRFLSERFDAMAAEAGPAPSGEEASTASGIRVMLGNPREAAPGEAEADPRVNLFFYRFEPYGFNADRLPTETEFLRAYCLVTPFGAMEESISAGENDLRLIGEVIRIFNEYPVFPVRVGEARFHIQALYNPLDMEDISRIWHTQGDVIYRPSVAYEFSIVPVVPNRPFLGSPAVASVGVAATADLKREAGVFTDTIETPPVQARLIDTRREDWAPAVCLVDQGRCVETLGFALGSPELARFTPRLWLAGGIGDQVMLFWDVWDRRSGWTTLPAAPNPVAIPYDRIAPTVADDADTIAVDLPPGFTEQAGQGVLYALREYRRASDGASLAVRSNPLLVTLYNPAAKGTS